MTNAEEIKKDKGVFPIKGGKKIKELEDQDTTLKDVRRKE